jgi:perosamine synthetase
VPLSRPDITEKEINYVLEVLRTPNLSLGPKLTEFEEKFANYLGVKHAIAVNSGTAGLHLALVSLNIGEGDAVITTPFSFIASANCILFVRATPIFVDIEPRTYNIDPEKIEEYIKNNCIRHKETGNIIDRRTGKRIKAILPVHVFGHPCDMSKIMELAHRYNLYIIEDACEAIGAEYCSKLKAQSSKLKDRNQRRTTHN